MTATITVYARELNARKPPLEGSPETGSLNHCLIVMKSEDGSSPMAFRATKLDGQLFAISGEYTNDNFGPNTGCNDFFSYAELNGMKKNTLVSGDDAMVRELWKSIISRLAAELNVADINYSVIGYNSNGAALEAANRLVDAATAIGLQSNPGLPPDAISPGGDLDIFGLTEAEFRYHESVVAFDDKLRNIADICMGLPSDFYAQISEKMAVLEDASSDFRTSMGRMFDLMGTGSVDASFTKFMNAYTDLGTDLSYFFPDDGNVQGILNSTSHIIEGIVDISSYVKNEIFQRIANCIQEKINSEIGGLGSAINGLVLLKDESSAIILEMVREYFENESDNLINSIDDKIGWLSDIIGQRIQSLADVIQNPIANLSNTIQSIFDAFTNATKPVFLGSPIALDLDADGIERIPLASSTAFFDLDNDGFREKTEWISGDDGLLVLDANGNGRIDDVSELFGDDIHANGFAKLATYDSNGDAVINAGDTVFDQFQIWRDLNGNGLTEAGELKTLAEEGVQSISTSHDQNLQSTFTFTNGSTGVTEDVYFEHDQINAVYNGPIELSPDVLVLPWLRGYGTVKSLPVAMSDDPVLMAMVYDISESTSLSDMFSKVDELLACWAGAASIDPNEMRSNGDFSDRKLTILESFMGQDFYMTINNVVRNYPRGEEAISSLESAYATLRDHIFTNLVVQTGVGGKFSDAIYNFQEDKITFPVSDQDLVSCFADTVNGSTMEDSIFIGMAIQSISADTGVTLEMVSEFVSSEVRHVFANMNTLFFGRALGGDLFTDGSSLSVPNIMVGFSGDDTISSGWNDDVIVGGGGIDTINSGAGNDLVFAGDGMDDINGGFGDDVIYGEAGDDAIYGLDGYDTLHGGEGADRLYGYEGNDILAGGSGVDRLEGGSGDDTYIFNPGDGHDVIYDYSYYFSGMDAINFGEGILRSDALFSLQDNNLVVKFQGNPGDSITIEDWKYSRSRVENFTFSDGTTLDVAGVLSDIVGTEGDDTITWTESAITVHGLAGNDTIETGSDNDVIDGGAGNDIIRAGWGDNVVSGGSGDDTISAWSGNDTLAGGTGNDRLEGAGGDDTYIFYPGDGRDTIFDYDYSASSNDTLRIGGRISPSDSVFSLQGDDLVITFGAGRRSRTSSRTDARSSVRDSVTIEGWLNSHSRIENIVFDRASLDAAGVMSSVNGTNANDTIHWWESALSYNGLAGDDTIYTGYGADTLYGNDGNDEIDSGSGDDTVYGGNGNDTVYGGYGNDRLYGQAGDDILMAGNGNDIIRGGTGDDRIEGGQGNDTFIFNRGDGQDTIYDYFSGSSDTIKFQAGITAEDIGVLRDSNNHLVVGYSDTDAVTVEYFEYAVEKFQLSDGAYLTNTAINQILQDISAYAVQEGIALDSVNDVRQNHELMNIVASAWQSG